MHASPVYCLPLSCVSTLARVRRGAVERGRGGKTKFCSSSIGAVTYFSETLSSGSPMSRSPDSPRCHARGPVVADVRSPAFVPFTQTPCQYLTQHGSDPFPRVCILCKRATPHSLSLSLSLSLLKPERHIFRAVSQILPYIEA